VILDSRLRGNERSLGEYYFRFRSSPRRRGPRAHFQAAVVILDSRLHGNEWSLGRVLRPAEAGTQDTPPDSRGAVMDLHAASQH